MNADTAHFWLLLSLLLPCMLLILSLACRWFYDTLAPITVTVGDLLLKESSPPEMYAITFQGSVHDNLGGVATGYRGTVFAPSKFQGLTWPQLTELDFIYSRRQMRRDLASGKIQVLNHYDHSDSALQAGRALALREHANMFPTRPNVTPTERQPL